MANCYWQWLCSPLQTTWTLFWLLMFSVFSMLWLILRCFSISWFSLFFALLIDARTSWLRSMIAVASVLTNRLKVETKNGNPRSVWNNESSRSLLKTQMIGNGWDSDTKNSKSCGTRQWKFKIHKHKAPISTNRAMRAVAQPNVLRM